MSICLVVLLHTVWSVTRVQSRLQERHRHDLAKQGRLLAAVLDEVRQAQEKPSSAELIDDVDAAVEKQELNWIPWGPHPHEAFAGNEADWQRLGRGDRIPPRATREGDGLVTYVPVKGPERIHGVLELRARRHDDGAEHAEVIVDRVTMAALLIVVCAVVVLLTSMRLVGRPLAGLTAHAQRVAEGDLSGTVPVRGGDEIARLSSEMNTMTTRLEAMRAQVREEHSRRIAALVQLRHAERLKSIGALMSATVHEMGTPLNVISGCAKRIVRRQVDPQRLTTEAQMIVDQADRLTEEIRHLLNFARRRPKREPAVPAREVIDASLALLKPVLDRARVGVDVVIAGDPTMAEADPNQLEQVVVNLVTNATQAMESVRADAGDGRRLACKAEVVRTGSPLLEGEERGDAIWVRISVSDAGVGMDAETLERVFEPFFTTKEEDQGTGLGLTVSQEIVVAHGGWIAVDSEPGRGTTFHVFIPSVGG